MKSRIEQLEEFAKEDPQDPFNLYALALEYQKIDLQKASIIFNKLIMQHEDYVPTYYHLGMLYEQLGQRDMAIQTFEAGIAAATRARDLKASRELQAARQALLFDE